MLSASAGPEMSLFIVELDVWGQVLNHSEEFCASLRQDGLMSTDASLNICFIYRRQTSLEILSLSAGFK